MYRRWGKRLLDILVAVPVLLFLLPFFLVLALLLWICQGEPPLFIQPRPGLKGKIFSLVKFRTMRTAFDREGNALPDSERISAIGSFLRRTSIDELPQLWNVIRGEMSLVGPRPLLVGYLPLYSGEQARRHDVRPGITGWAQVNGRNALSWEQKFELDVWYTRHVCPGVDMKIIRMSVTQALSTRKMKEVSDTSVQAFRGS